MVEPLAGVLGAAGVTFAEPVLPYALAFAAGAMIYVVIDDIVPEAHQRSVVYYFSVCTFLQRLEIRMNVKKKKEISLSPSLAFFLHLCPTPDILTV